MKRLCEGKSCNDVATFVCMEPFGILRFRCHMHADAQIGGHVLFVGETHTIEKPCVVLTGLKDVSEPIEVESVVISDDRVYDEDDFQEDRGRLNTICDNLLFQKGADYATKTDRLANFRKSRAVNEARQVWGVLFEKHFNAIMKWVRDGRVDSEPVESRFADLRNYIDLGYALFCEEERVNVMKEPI